VMAERQVSIAGVTHPLPRPFLVLATQNPIESEGVYPLPEAQRDRFLMKVQVPYPTEIEEMEIVRRMGVDPPHAAQILDPVRLEEIQRLVDDVFVHHAVVQYAVRLVLATRDPAAYGLPDLAGLLAYGASPRASLGLVAASRALATLRGRDYVVPSDVADIAPEILPHRLVLSFDALADGRTADEIAALVVAGIEPPRVAPSQAHTAPPPGPPIGPPPTQQFPRFPEPGSAETA
jgi:MoxR-like ATPase